MEIESKQEYFADLILPLPLQGLFTYSLPHELKEGVFPGSRVVVQFGHKKLFSGIVYKLHQSKPEGYKIKKIISILDSSPIVLPVQLAFWKWISEYYMCTTGEVYKAAVPSGLKLESETFLYPNPSFKGRENLNRSEETAFEHLSRKKYSTIGELSTVTGLKNGFSVVKKLIDKNALLAEESIKTAGNPKTEIYVSLSAETKPGEIDEIFNRLKKAPRQLQLIKAYITKTSVPGEKGNWPEIRAKELLEETGASAQTLLALINKGIITGKRVIPTRKNFRKPVLKTEAKELNPDQKSAFEKINKFLREKDVVLLHGVTSSGKTEVYIRMIAEQIGIKKQVLYLLPEIAITTQIIKRLENVFGSTVGVYHSRLSNSERVEIWKNVLNGGENSYNVILGVRSSLFLPFRDLGLVIVDEEHETTYKQFDPAPRYNARDAAIMLAKLHRAKTLLGTATPSVESYFNAMTGKFGIVKMEERFGNIRMPGITLADTRRAGKRKQMKSHFTPELMESIKQALYNKEQIILFQNRRGFAPFIECESCGWVPHCSQCDVSLTCHKQKKSLICHYCSNSVELPSSCSKCGSNSVKTCGFGTEKIESDLSLFFPEARVARMDLDSTRKKRSYEQIISRFEAGGTDILVGTQMISKGLDFDKVNLVGILNADNMLHFPDFRAYERSFQLISQVSGRAGRKYSRGNVIIQTGQPDHPVFKYIIEGNYKDFFTSQINERKEFKYPPYYRLIKLTLRHKNREIVEKAADQLAESLYSYFGNSVLGPDFPLIPRIQNWNIKNILLKIDRKKNLTQCKAHIKELMRRISSQPGYRSLQIIPDADPL